MRKLALLSVLLPIVLSCNDATGPGQPAELELSVTQLTLSAGASDTIAAIVRDGSGREIPNMLVTWSSSDTTIVSVADGILTADSSGTALITAQFDSLAASLDVTVVQGLAALVVEPGDTTFRLFDSAPLRITALDGTGRVMPIPSGVIAYATTDSATLSVDGSGIVKGIGWGSADVIVTLNGVSGSTTVTSEPTEVDMGGVHLVSLALGRFHACGLDVDGAAYCWGKNDQGAAGHDTSLAHITPGQPVPTALQFTSIGAGDDLTCGLSVDQDVWCWGSNRGGALGQGRGAIDPAYSDTLRHSSVPLLVTGGHKWQALGVGQHFQVCAVSVAGTVYCWGNNDLGQLGRLPRSSLEPAIAPIEGSFTATSVDVGHSTGCAALIGGSAVCWGVPYDLPEIIPDGAIFTQVSASHYPDCGVTSSGEAYCWGRAESTQVGRDLGDNGLKSDLPADPVVGGLLFKKVAVNDENTCGITTAGQIHCWGRDTPWPGFPNTPPKALGGPHEFVDIDEYLTAGFCALTSEGRVFCWF